MARRRMGLQSRLVPHRRAGFSPWVDQFETRLLLSDIPVTNTLDSGAGSFRDALSAAISGDHIVFQIPSTDPNFNAATGSWTIPLLSALPPVFTSNLTIDGLTQQSQPGASTAHPVVQITRARPLLFRGMGSPWSRTATRSEGW